MIITVPISSCSNDRADEETTTVENPQETSAYLSPNGSAVRETRDLSATEWDPSTEQPQCHYLNDKGIDTFIVSKGGQNGNRKIFRRL